MDVLGTPAAHSLAGLSEAERAALRQRRGSTPSAATVRTRPDETDLIVVSTEGVDPIRSLKGNDQQEAREDRQEHGAYLLPGCIPPGSPRLDLEA